MNTAAHEVVRLIQDQFDRLNAKAKPRHLAGSKNEWTSLSGIVLSRAQNSGEHTIAPQCHFANGNVYECVALGTGLRCLPASKLSHAFGRCLHDWHAEVVAIRALNLFLLHECESLANDTAKKSHYVQYRPDSEKFQDKDGSQPFALREGVRIHMYCSEAPCGDASMELVMNEQTDATPWSPEAEPTQASSSPLHGRAYFAEKGAVRRKPSRADAPPTLSKSCSDKLALKQCTSLLSSATSLLIHPSNAYLHQLIIPEAQYVSEATRRAFHATGRMRTVLDASQGWKGGYRFQPFTLATTGREFAYSRRHESLRSMRVSGSNITAMWTPVKHEVLIGGSIQGNKQFALKGASAISRYLLWTKAARVAKAAGLGMFYTGFGRGQNYRAWKQIPALSPRQQVKADVKTLALHNWQPNDGDDDFVLELDAGSRD